MTTEALKSPRDRSDLSQFLIHLTKDGTYEHFIPKSGLIPGFQNVRRSVRAKDSLVEILSNKQIEARSPFGYFKLKINMYRPFYNKVFRNSDADPNWIMSVCFSETPLSELTDFYRATTGKRNQYRKYGIAFLQEKLRALGGNPIFYVDSRRKDLLAALDNSLAPSFVPMMHLIETFGPLVVQVAEGHSDFRWEREWRKKDSLKFSHEDVAFVICPEAEMPSFEALTNGEITLIDPDWDRSKLEDHLKKVNPQLLNHF